MWETDIHVYTHKREELPRLNELCHESSSVTTSFSHCNPLCFLAPVLQTDIIGKKVHFECGSKKQGIQKRFLLLFLEMCSRLPDCWSNVREYSLLEHARVFTLPHLTIVLLSDGMIMITRGTRLSRLNGVNWPSKLNSVFQVELHVQLLLWHHSFGPTDLW